MTYHVPAPVEHTSYIIQRSNCGLVRDVFEKMQNECNCELLLLPWSVEICEEYWVVVAADQSGKAGVIKPFLV